MTFAERISLYVCFLLSIVTVVFGITYYHLQRNDAMRSNIESAIVKGIDPMAVRCAYGESDTVCVVYATSVGKKPTTPPDLTAVKK